jgi:GDP-D-mannose dehydratase
VARRGLPQVPRAPRSSYLRGGDSWGVAPKRALITGVTGQDGSYFAGLLIAKGYEVFGLVRRLSSPNMANLSAVHDKIQFIDGDLFDQSSLSHSVRVSRPDEIYSSAAQSFVATSFGKPVLTGEKTGLGATRLLEATRIHAARILTESERLQSETGQTEPGGSEFWRRLGGPRYS